MLTLKYNPDGIISRYKARLVAKGFTQSYRVDYFETFPPIAKLTYVQVLLSIVANFDWPLYQVDVKKCISPWGLEGRVLYGSSAWICG